MKTVQELRQNISEEIDQHKRIIKHGENAHLDQPRKLIHYDQLYQPLQTRKQPSLVE